MMILYPSRLRIGTAQDFWNDMDTREASYIQIDTWQKGKEYPWFLHRSGGIHGVLLSGQDISEAFQYAYKEVHYDSNLVVWLVRPVTKMRLCNVSSM
jgi:hypothetical protein